MTLKEFLKNIAHNKAVVPSDELQMAAAVALHGYGALKQNATQEQTEYSLNENVKVFGESGKYSFVIAANEKGKQEQLISVDANDGKFSASLETSNNGKEM